MATSTGPERPECDVTPRGSSLPSIRRSDVADARTAILEGLTALDLEDYRAATGLYVAVRFLVQLCDGLDDDTTLARLSVVAAALRIDLPPRTDGGEAVR